MVYWDRMGKWDVSAHAEHAGVHKRIITTTFCTIEIGGGAQWFWSDWTNENVIAHLLRCIWFCKWLFIPLWLFSRLIDGLNIVRCSFYDIRAPFFSSSFSIFACVYNRYARIRADPFVFLFFGASHFSKMNEVNKMNEPTNKCLNEVF